MDVIRARARPRAGAGAGYSGARVQPAVGRELALGKTWQGTDNMHL